MSYAELPKIFLLTLVFSIAAFAQKTFETHSNIRRHVENKDYQTAVAELQTLKRTDEKIFALNNYDYLLARIMEKSGDVAGATANYQAVINRNSVLSEYALWHLAQIFRHSGNLFAERIYLRKLLTVAPESLLTGATNWRLTQSYFESKDYNTVINQLSAVSIKSNSFGKNNEQRTTNSEKRKADEGQMRERIVLLGQAYLQTNRLDEAREIFTQLINNLPNPAQPDDYALAGAKALDELAVGKENFGKIAPPLPDTEHFRRAQIYQFNRSFSLARLHYQAIVEKHPASGYVADALYQTGRGLAQEKSFDQAINWFERVQAEFPDLPIAKDALSQTAAAYARVNKPKEAISRYQKFIEKYADEENVERAFLNIVDVLRDTGANAEALRWTARTRETFRGKLPEALALFAEARIYIAQNDWTNALAALNNLQNFPDLGGTRVPGGTNEAEVLFLKGFALENLNRPAEAIDVYLSIPDGRNEYYGWRATERLKRLASGEKTQSLVREKINESTKNIETRNAEAQRQAAQAVRRLTENPETRAKMLDIVRKSYAALPAYQKIPGGKILELGRLREIAKEERPDLLADYHQTLADELLFLGLYDEAAPELENSDAETRKRGDAVKILGTNLGLGITKNQADYSYTLAEFYKRGERANRAVSYVEPLWKNVPADYEIELIPRGHLELLYPAPYADSFSKHAAPRAVDARFALSIMRQESRFRADVKSYAAARGLMQFISTTADRIALELKRENFRQDELYDPPTAILFGSQYLSNLFVIFPNQPPAVAASYNGGEDNISRWAARSKSDDPDRYVPEIVFSQSKDYVYKVMAGYRVYQMLYDEKLRTK